MDTCVYSFTGHYGSGKTEAAVNFAMKLKRQGRNTALIDLDIVNPFFRSADARELLETLGIRTEIPLYANTNVDVPALTGVMGALIRDEAYDVVLDVGGDDLGAKALGRYREDILSRKKHLQFFVMNPNRPFTKDLPSASRIYDEIEAASGRKYESAGGYDAGDRTGRASAPESARRTKARLYSISCRYGGRGRRFAQRARGAVPGRKHHPNQSHGKTTVLRRRIPYGRK